MDQTCNALSFERLLEMSSALNGGSLQTLTGCLQKRTTDPFDCGVGCACRPIVIVLPLPPPPPHPTRDRLSPSMPREQLLEEQNRVLSRKRVLQRELRKFEEPIRLQLGKQRVGQTGS